MLGLLLACSSGRPTRVAPISVAPGEADCPEVEEDAPGVEDVLDAMPACEATEGDLALDLDAGCAGSACVGMTYDDLRAELGYAAVCTGYSKTYAGRTSSGTSCFWMDGVTASFKDEDEDWEPDDGAATSALGLSSDWPGGTVDGVGPGASLRCALDALGDPIRVSYEAGDDGVLVPTLLQWGHPGVYVFDNVDNTTIEGTPDGLIDSLIVTGN